MVPTNNSPPVLVTKICALDPTLSEAATPHPRALPARPAHMDEVGFLYSIAALAEETLCIIKGVGTEDDKCNGFSGFVTPIPTEPSALTTKGVASGLVSSSTTRALPVPS